MKTCFWLIYMDVTTQTTFLSEKIIDLFERNRNLQKYKKCFKIDKKIVSKYKFVFRHRAIQFDT